jgi:adenine-specific DNA-methyltransferase
MFTKEQIKNTGATFTPKELANYLSNKVLLYNQGQKISVLDPACGEGELLVAIGGKLSELGSEFNLTGYDANSHYLSLAQDRMLQFGKDSFDLVSADFLKAIDVTQNQTVLDLFAPQRSQVNSSFDIVIANPPYVRTQILGSDQAPRN